MKAETITVDDLEMILTGDKIEWKPAITPAGTVKYKIDHSIAVLEARIERLLACRAALQAMKKAS